MPPVVTVVCTSYNQNRFVVQAIESVLAQSYGHIQFIVIDNGSTDGTRQTIESFIQSSSEIEFLALPQNIGLCKAFNLGLARATGKYIIDLAADDVMPAHKIERQVAQFEKLSGEYAVVFTNAQYIDEQGLLQSYHYALNTQNRAIETVPDGWVFDEVLKRYFICTPTMMIRREVLVQIGGYDESLAYEDFDFWVRTSRDYKYHYLDEVLMQKRIVRGSMGSLFYKPNNDMLRSSWVVCVKAFELVDSPRQRDLLAGRIQEFIKKCVVVGNHPQAVAFGELLGKIQKPVWRTTFLIWLSGVPLPINAFYHVFARLRSFCKIKILHTDDTDATDLH